MVIFIMTIAFVIFIKEFLFFSHTDDMYGQGGTLAVNVAALGNSYRMLSQQNRQVKTHVARSSQG